MTKPRRFTTEGARHVLLDFLTDYLIELRDGGHSVTLYGHALATNDETTTLADVLKCVDPHAWTDELRAASVRAAKAADESRVRR